MSKTQKKHALRLVSYKITNPLMLNEVLLLGPQNVILREFEEHIKMSVVKELPERHGTKLRYYTLAANRTYCCGEYHYTTTNGKVLLRIWGHNTLSKFGELRTEIPGGNIMHHAGRYYIFLSGFVMAEIEPVASGYLLYPVVAR